MRISTKGRYSLIALLYLALLDRESSTSMRELAGATGISEGYLEQLFIPLRKSGIIQGVRGPQGGYFFEKAPKTIAVGDILRSVEGSLSPTECVDRQNCPAESSCPSYRTWLALHTSIADCVDSITLQDLVDDYLADHEPEYAI
ncbi:MAG: Rrf2 family transcriptional regulator [Spirochaetaceae bacterium]|jgi:Rrf2 family protein|nr:Rrf2 family transcriptional regulator [Spirochaetaceae bacterium]